MNKSGRSLTKVLENFILFALLWLDLSINAAAPSLEESRKQQFQQFLNQNDRDDLNAGDSSKPLRSRMKLNQPLDEPVKLRQLIEKLLEVQCSTINMTVKLHYDSTYSRLTHDLANALAYGLLYVDSDQKSPCVGRKNEERGEISLTMDYGSCGIENDYIAHSATSYSTTVTVEFGNWSSNAHLRDFRENYIMTCVNPLDNDKKKDVHSLKLFEQKYAETPWTYPHNVEKGGNVFLRGDVALSNGYNSSDLHSFPVNCWLAQTDHYVDEQFRRNLLSQGCPANDDRGRGLSFVHHLSTGTGVSFSMVNSLLWPERPQSVYVHCEFLSCVQSYTSGIAGVQKCPSTTYCAGPPQLSHALPEHFRGVPKYTVVAGPLDIVEKQQKETFKEVLPIPSVDLNCQLACAQTSIDSQRSVGAEPQHFQTFYVEGVSTKMVVAISFASFLIGMLMMGALWFVHVRTDPKRKLLKTRATALNSSANKNNNNCRRTSSSPLNYNENNLQQTAKLMLNPL